MNILAIIPYMPNLIRVRSYNLLRSLAGRGNDVTLLTITTTSLEEESAGNLRECGITVKTFALPTWRSLINAARAGFTRDPLQSFYSWHAGLAEEARRMASERGQVDVIHVEHLRGARYAEYLLRSTDARLQSRVPVVWDSVDSISYLFRQAARQSRKLSSRLMTRFELPRTERYEGRMAGLFDATLVTSTVDRQALLDLLPGENAGAGGRIRVLPNGVDLDFFHPEHGTARDPATLVISGKMSYHANVSMTLHMVNEIIPHIWAQKPDARLVIVGKDPPAQIARLAEDPRIIVSGYVPDIRPYLHSAAVAVAPLTYGAGIQNKVLEAMACGTAVVTTPLAARNLSAVHGHELLVADQPADFARAVLALLDDPARRDAVGAAGRRYVETCHDWHVIAGNLEQVYQEAGERASGGR